MKDENKIMIGLIKLTGPDPKKLRQLLDTNLSREALIEMCIMLLDDLEFGGTHQRMNAVRDDAQSAKERFEELLVDHIDLKIENSKLKEIIGGPKASTDDMGDY
jgi:hypothetical protein